MQLQRVTSLRRHTQANVPATSYCLRHVLDNGALDSIFDFGTIIVSLFTLYSPPLIVFSSLFPYLSPPLLIFSFENRLAPFPGQIS